MRFRIDPLRAQVDFEGSMPARHGAKGNLVLNVDPADAQVAVDGVMQGLGSDFDGTHGALQLSPGPHQIKVSHNGYVSQELTVYAADDGRQVVQIALMKE